MGDTVYRDRYSILIGNKLPNSCTEENCEARIIWKTDISFEKVTFKKSIFVTESLISLQKF